MLAAFRLLACVCLSQILQLTSQCSIVQHDTRAGPHHPCSECLTVRGQGRIKIVLCEAAVVFQCFTICVCYPSCHVTAVSLSSRPSSIPGRVGEV